MSRLLLLLGQYDFTWDVRAQMTDGTTFPLNNYHEIDFDGVIYNDRIFLGTYQDTTHVVDSLGTHLCNSSVHIHNTKFLTNTTYSVDSGATSTLPIPTSSCTLVMTFTSNGGAVATNAAKFYAYDGSIDAVPPVNIDFKAAEGGNTITWISANGLLNALPLANQAAATGHTFYLACSFSPLTLGLKTGKVKLSFNYI